MKSMEKSTLIEIVPEVLWLDPEIKDRELCIFQSSIPISYDEDLKKDYKLFTSHRYGPWQIDNSTLKVELKFRSMEELTRIFSWLIGKGWNKRMRIKQTGSMKTEPQEKLPYGLGSIGDIIHHSPESSHQFVHLSLYIWTNRKRRSKYSLNNLRKTLKTLPQGYYFLWTDEYCSMAAEDMSRKCFEELFIIKTNI